MMLRGIMTGIAVSLSATVFASAGWSQSQSNRKGAGYDAGFDLGGYDNYAGEYNAEIKKSVELLNSESERLGIKQITEVLDTKSNRDILALKLAPDVCQEIACRGVSADTVRRYVEAYTNMRGADVAQQTALRNAAAAERSTLIAAVSASISLLSLLISGLSYRRAGRSTKSAIPA